MQNIDGNFMTKDISIQLQCEINILHQPNPLPNKKRMYDFRYTIY